MSLVLVVEDDGELRDLMACFLETAGIPFRLAPNGRIALREARRNPQPRVVLLDLMMPIMDGWEFRRHQLQDRAISHIPVVVVSALSPIHYADLAATAVVPKPCDFDRLLDVVKRFL